MLRNYKEKFKILLIEDNPGDARLIQEMLNDTNTAQFELSHVERLHEGMEWLGNNVFDVLLLALGLPDSQGFKTFVEVLSQAPPMPIVILTGLDDEMLAIKAVQMGAQDYLVKGQVDGSLLSHAIRYGIGRDQLLVKLRNLSLIDELTGLYNRRAFFKFAKQYFKLASREERGIWLLFGDFDELKRINDAMGHNEGDQALIDTANVIKKTFRESNIIARIGGDEFAVLAIGAHKDSLNALTTRLQKNLEVHNTKNNDHYELSLSIGAAYYDPECPCSIEELIVQADKSMYRQKRVKQVFHVHGMTNRTKTDEYR